MNGNLGIRSLVDNCNRRISRRAFCPGLALCVCLNETFFFTGDFFLEVFFVFGEVFLDLVVVFFVELSAEVFFEELSAEMFLELLGEPRRLGVDEVLGLK